MGETKCSGDILQTCETVQDCQIWTDSLNCTSENATCVTNGTTAVCEPNGTNNCTVVPPVGGISNGTGGSAYPDGSWTSASGINYIIVVPTSYVQSVPNRFMVVYSGTEGADSMAMNLTGGAGDYYGLGDMIYAILDGVTYNDNGQAGATAMEDVRSKYNIDNDQTFLLSESAGTGAGLILGFQLKQSWFAAYWANDVNTSLTPSQTAAELCFAPWGNAGPGGDYVDADIIVNGMSAAGYRLPSDAPYSGPGAGTHGSSDQFFAALQFYAGKSRQ